MEAQVQPVETKAPPQATEARKLAVRFPNALMVHQKKEWGEILTGWETKNRYEVKGTDGTVLMYAGEVGGGLGATLLRGFLKNKRPFSMEIRTTNGEQQLMLKRPWTWFFSRLEVRDANGKELGLIKSTFAFFSRVLVLEDTQGRELAQIRGPFFRPWTFRILVQEQVQGHIRKKFGGLLKEAFSDADTFGVEFHESWNETLRSLCFAATFLIDFLYFENNS